MSPPIRNRFEKVGGPLPRIYGYVRSSAVRPRRKSDLIEQQQLAIKVWAAQHKRPVFLWPADLGWGAITPLFGRPHGKELLTSVRPGDTIIAARFDRLFGTPADAHASLVLARQLEIHICALDLSDGALKLEQSAPALAILLAVAADTAYSRSLDQKAIKRVQAARGRFRGGNVLFGFQPADDGTLVCDEAQQVFIARLRHLREKGMTYNELEKVARAEGYTLTGPGIHKILARSN